MQQPEFWNNINLVAILLLPLSFLYNLISKINLFIQSINKYKSNIKIICVGNINIGGVGKTQVVLKLSEILLNKNLKICILMHGYNSSLSKKDYVTLVNLNKHTAKEVGDEALMIKSKLSKFENAHVIINNSKKLGIKYAEKLNPDIIIMDDGMQNETIEKHLSICVIDGSLGFGNKLIIPAGPLRESIKSGIKKSDVAIIIRKDKKQVSTLLQKYNIPIFHGKIISQNKNININKKIFAFCSIGRPEKFFQSMKDFGFKPDITKIFSDHYVYTDDDIYNIINKYKKNYIIFTTDKDYVKIPNKYKKFIKTFSVKLDILEKDFNNFIYSLIK